MPKVINRDSFGRTMGDNLKADSKNVLIGAIVGIASILPGVSGGLIAVLCGIYERLIEDLSDLRHKIFSDFRFLFTIGVGLLVGMMVCAIVLDYTLDVFKVASMAFFFGLILAQIPDVYVLSEHDRTKGFTVGQIASFVFGLGVIIVLMFVNTTDGAGIQPEEHSFLNMVLFCICGILLAISKIMPGISGSSLLIALGLFDVTISSMAHLDLYFLVPLGIGLVIGILGFAKVMDRCLKNYRTQTYFLIMGLTIGSLMIIVQELVMMGLTTGDVVSAVVAAIVGVIVSYGFSAYGKRLAN